MRTEIDRLEAICRQKDEDTERYRSELREAIQEVHEATGEAFEADCKAFWRSVRRELQSHLHAAITGGGGGDIAGGGPDMVSKSLGEELRAASRQLESLSPRVGALEAFLQQLKEERGPGADRFSIEIAKLREESIEGRNFLADALRAEGEAIDALRMEVGAAREEVAECTARVARQVAGERQNQADFQTELLALTRGELETSRELLGLLKGRTEALLDEATRQNSPGKARGGWQSQAVRDALKELDAKVNTQVGLHLESAAAGYEEARRGFEASLAEVARQARSEAERGRDAVIEEMSQLRREAGQLEIDFHEWCHGERIAREEAMRHEESHLRKFLDARLDSSSTSRTAMVQEVTEALEPRMREAAREATAGALVCVEDEISAVRGEFLSCGDSVSLRDFRSEVELRISQLHSDLSQHMESTVRGVKGSLASQLQELSTQLDRVSSQEAASTNASERSAKRSQSLIAEIEARLIGSNRQLQASLVELRAESHALHGGHVRELDKLSADLDEQQRHLQATLSLLEGGVKREMEQLREEVKRLKLKLIQLE